jgi:DNA-binding MarR family transcriptional regulator
VDSIPIGIIRSRIVLSQLFRVVKLLPMKEDVVRPADSSSDPLPLPDHRPRAVGFLLSQLGFEVSSRFTQLIAEVDLDPRQFALMRAIQASEGHSQNAVGEWLRIPPSSMVALVDHLEERGLVERRPHPTDRRSRTLHMTPRGSKTLKRATALTIEFEKTICGGFDESDRAELLDLLSAVADNLGLVQGLHPGATKELATRHSGSPHSAAPSS